MFAYRGIKNNIKQVVHAISYRKSSGVDENVDEAVEFSASKLQAVARSFTVFQSVCISTLGQRLLLEASQCLSVCFKPQPVPIARSFTLSHCVLRSSDNACSRSFTLSHPSSDHLNSPAYLVCLLVSLRM